MASDDRGCRGGLEEALGQTIRALRQERRLSQQQLAERAGISRSYLNQLEKGSREFSRGVSTDIIERLAHALDVSPSLLVAASSARREGRSGDYLRAQADLLEQGERGGPLADLLSPAPSRRAVQEGALFEQAPAYAPQPPSTRSHIRALREFEMLLPYLTDEDLEILLGMMRRLARTG